MLAVTSAFAKGVMDDKPIIGQPDTLKEQPTKLSLHVLADAVDEYVYDSEYYL